MIPSSKLTVRSPEPRLKVFFSYYGAKHRAAPKYPQPTHDTIIEPFAGAAGYSVLWHDRKVQLWDVSHHVVGVWSFLISESEDYIRSIPANIFHIDEMADNYPQEAKWLVGFMMNHATSSPCNQHTTKSHERPDSRWGYAVRERLASSLKYIRHWQVNLGSYEEIPNQEATWYIDPPYNSAAGRHYPHHDIDYEHLGEWCKTRTGQVMVCEQVGATWLPFEPFALISTLRCRNGKSKSHEAIWTNSTLP